MTFQNRLDEINKRCLSARILSGGIEARCNCCLDISWAIEKLEETIKVLEEIANEDYRGNRSGASQTAHYFLKKLEEE